MLLDTDGAAVMGAMSDVRRSPIPACSANASPRRSTLFIFFLHLMHTMSIHHVAHAQTTYLSHTVPGPSGPGPHFSTHLPSLYRPACPHCRHVRCPCAFVAGNPPGGRPAATNSGLSDAEVFVGGTTPCWARPCADVAVVCTASCACTSIGAGSPFSRVPRTLLRPPPLVVGVAAAAAAVAHRCSFSLAFSRSFRSFSRSSLVPSRAPYRVPVSPPRSRSRTPCPRPRLLGADHPAPSIRLTWHQRLRRHRRWRAPYSRARLRHAHRLRCQHPRRRPGPSQRC